MVEDGRRNTGHVHGRHDSHPSVAFAAFASTLRFFLASPPPSAIACKRSASPPSEGAAALTSARVSRICSALRKSSGVVILSRGRILAEQYWKIDSPEKTASGGRNPYFHFLLGTDSQGHPVEDVASAQKSVAAMLVGIAQQKHPFPRNEHIVEESQRVHLLKPRTQRMVEV